jgi:hypothetical protein
MIVKRELPDSSGSSLFPAQTYAVSDDETQWAITQFYRRHNRLICLARIANVRDNRRTPRGLNLQFPDQEDWPLPGVNPRANAAE